MNLRLLVSILVLTATVSRINCMDTENDNQKNINFKISQKKIEIIIPNRVQEVKFTNDSKNLVTELVLAWKDPLNHVLLSLKNKTSTKISPQRASHMSLYSSLKKKNLFPHTIESNNNKFIASLSEIGNPTSVDRELAARNNDYEDVRLKVWNKKFNKEVYSSDKIYTQITFSPNNTLLAAIYLTQPCGNLKTHIDVIKLDKLDNPYLILNDFDLRSTKLAQIFPSNPYINDFDLRSTNLAQIFPSNPYAQSFKIIK